MPDKAANYGLVVIGRNEGDRLKRCLSTLKGAAATIYVDSGSVDDSAVWAKSVGADVVILDNDQPFTAARARNAGFSHLRDIAPALQYVQFVDGDCELVRDWPQHALSFLEANPDFCAVFGRRRERFPDRSIYNQLCDNEWDTPIGEARAFGGDVMIQASALEAAGGYREDLIAGEDPELCVRLRALRYRIRRLDADMTLHDANMMRFGQWWRRNVRSGYAFAQGAHLHGAPPERHWVWESRRALLWGILIPLICLSVGLLFRPWGFLTFLIYPAQFIRRWSCVSGSPRKRAQYIFFEMLVRIPEALGQIRFALDKLSGRRASLMEYR